MKINMTNILDSKNLAAFLLLPLLITVGKGRSKATKLDYSDNFIQLIEVRNIVISCSL